MMIALLLTGLVYVFIGALAGILAGILGIGGGVIVVPALLFTFSQTQVIPNTLGMHAAAGSSLAVMIITSLASIRAHIKHDDILWSAFNRLRLGIVLGTLAGGVLAEFIPTEWLKIIFALFLFFIAFKMYANRDVVRAAHFPKTWINRLVSFLIGLKSGLLGVGGGVLIIPYLTYCGVDVRKIAAVSNLCTLTVALVGTIVFIATGWQAMSSIPYATGYVYWPAVIVVAFASSITAPIGAKLNYVVPVKQLKYGFILVLLIIATRMLF